MSGPAPERDPSDVRSLLRPKQLAIQLVGFLAGAALLAWCIRGALPASGEASGFACLRTASPWLVVALVACTVGSAVVNGTLFWITVRPIQRLSWRDLQGLNLVANVLNLAPVRLGFLSRAWHHLRVDRVPFLVFGGWFSLLGALLVLGLGAAFGSVVVRPRLDWIWVLLLLGQMALGVVFLRVFVGGMLVKRFGTGLERLLLDPAATWGAGGLRLVDLGLYGLRMAIAARILGLEMSPGDAALLGLVAFVGSILPVGRLGFREFGVAKAAAWIGLTGEAATQAANELALLDSAAEIVFFVPTGGILLFWYLPRWRRALARPEA